MTREERYIEYDERIDRYLRNQMSDSERIAFEQDVDSEQELRERLVATALLVQGIASEGMRREGQAQLDAIKQMDEKQFKEASRGRKSSASLLRWASGIAAILVVGFGIYLTQRNSSVQGPLTAQESVEKSATPPKTSTKTTQPTLASLADEYNRPIASEPDEFLAIRKQLQNGDSKEEIMAVVYDIDKIEAPKYVEGAMGAENADVIKETQRLYTDCNHWYKAIAFLKANDKAGAIHELNELVKHSSNEDLINRALALLEKLK